MIFFYAALGIVRGPAITLHHMDLNDGYSVLMRAIQSPVEKLQVKAAFLLSALCGRDNPGKLTETLVKMGLIEQVAALLCSESLLPDTRLMNLVAPGNKLLVLRKITFSTNVTFTDVSFCRENLLGILNGLTNGNYLPALRECRRPELCLQLTLDRHRKEAKEEESIDEVQACISLLDRLFGDRDIGQDR